MREFYVRAGEVLSVVNSGLVLVYGLLLSVEIAGGCATRREKGMTAALCPALLLVQVLCWRLLGLETVRLLYPLIAHLPLVVLLIVGLKKPAGIAVVSTCTAYLCCQLPRWGGIAVTAATGLALAGELCYTLLLAGMYFLLRRHFVAAAYSAMTCSKQALLLFGSLPVLYYIFDYGTTVYSDALYAGIQVLNEFLPTALIVFYVLFLAAYHVQTQSMARAQMQSSLLEVELKQSQQEMNDLRRSAAQTAVYQHDMRHHLNLLEGLLEAGKTEQAAEYIRRVQSDVAALAHRRFCENETVNLLCASFAEKARHAGVRFTVDARLPGQLSVPDTELCALLSNGLENAIQAVSGLDEADRTVRLYCSVRLNKLLVEISNPCPQPPRMEDGVPASSHGAGHGYGCRSMQTIARRRGGLCVFRAAGGEFQVQIMLPVKEQEAV